MSAIPIPESTHVTTRPYVLAENENQVLEIPRHQADGVVYSYVVVVRRHNRFADPTLNTIEYWLREYNTQGVVTYDLPVNQLEDAIGIAFERTGFGSWREVEDSDEKTYTLSDIVAKTMDFHRGCDEGKREFLNDAFGYDPMSRHWGQEVTVTITQTYLITERFEGDPDDIMNSIDSQIRAENLGDNVDGLDRQSNRVQVTWA